MRAERFKVVSVLDEALTFTFQERLEYAGTRDPDAFKSKIVPGGKPVVFYIREVPHTLWEDYVDAPDAYPEKYKRAFMCGIEKVENLTQPDGVTLGTWVPSTKNQRSGAVVLDDEDLKLFAPAERAEIGSVIYTHSFLPRRMQATYLLPASLREPLVSQAAQTARASQHDAAVMTSGAPLAPSTPNPAETVKTIAHADASSGNRTAATAAIQPNP